LVECLAEIRLCSDGEPVSTLAQEYLVDVQLEYLVLGQTRFDLEGKQSLVKVFSRERKKFRATCMVMVLAPWRAPPTEKFEITARTTPM
jgi:hypothetical protein